MTQRAAVRGRGRRLLATLALGLVAVSALSACQTQSGTAAFVGDTRITVDDVERSISGALTAQKTCEANAPAAAAAAAAAGTTPPTCPNVPVEALRTLAVRDKVINALAGQYAAAHGIKAPAVDAQAQAQVANELQVAANDEFVTDYATARAWPAALEDGATPVTPTDAELRGIYDKAKAAGITTDTFSQDKAAISQITGVGQAFAVQRGLAALAKSEGVSISPRYQPTAEIGTPTVGLELPLLQIGSAASPLTVLTFDPIGPASPAVVSVPSAVVPTGAGGNAP